MSAARTYLALGDSYTCGESVPSAESFPFQLAAALRERGENVADPLVIATTGWTTDELTAAIAAKRLARSFDIITLLIGVNNQYRGKAKGYTLERYRTEFSELLATAVHLAGDVPAHVAVLSIPDWGATPFADDRDRTAITKDIDRYNALNRELSLKRGVQYVDITQLSRQTAEDRSLVATDGLHYAAAMYAQWVTALAQVL